MTLTTPLLFSMASSAQATAPARAAFTVQNLVSDQPGVAPLTDPDLVNPWGLAASPTSPLWVANNGTNTSTLYSGALAGGPATKAALIVAVPGGAPSGQVFNDTAAFVVTGPNGSGPARFLFDSESGELTGWNPAAAPTDAIIAARSPGAVYKGLALLHADAGPMLLAADFRHGRIDVFDGTFQRVQLSPGAFRDRFLPRGFAPFNVAVLGDSVYVAYALRGPGGIDPVEHRGLGFVDRFSTTGQFQRRVASLGTLNAPWGLAIAPPSFGAVAGHLLVGNFGDGRISVFDTGGGFDGLLRDTTGHAIAIDGLWALQPGTATEGGVDGVWFSAGPDDEAHGLLGVIRLSA
jgi:uncharacterized protein (TIGR03118 family)